MNRLSLSLLFSACTLLPTPALLAQAADKSADLKAKEVDKRLAAIDWTATSGRKDAETLLAPLLSDRDWEIQERTAIALGKVKAKTALKPLIDLAIEGDVVRVRRAAALAVGAIDPAEGAASIWKRCKGKTQVHGQDALALVLRGQP